MMVDKQNKEEWGKEIGQEGVTKEMRWIGNTEAGERRGSSGQTKVVNLVAGAREEAEGEETGSGN